MNDNMRELLHRLNTDLRDEKFARASDIGDSWTFVEYLRLYLPFESPAGDVRRIQWANENCHARYSRTLQGYWFEDPKDAFIFQLIWEGK